MRDATRLLIWIVVALVLVLAPLGLPPFAMTLLTEAVILGLFAMSLDLMFGYTRLVSFGHAAAYGLGAYACGWMLLHTGLNDTQVAYWEPAKYVARLRTLKTDANPLLFRINLEVGHGGASGRFDALREIAEDDVFLLVILGLAE